MVFDNLLSAMAVCHYLPRLSLDRPIPKHVLQRRGAISFSSSTSLFKSLPRLERRGGISFDRTDKAAIYVRMLGDVRVKSKQLMSSADGRRSSLPDNEYKIIEAIDNNVRRTSLKHSRGLSLPRVCVQQSSPKIRHHIPPTSPPQLDSGYNGQANQLLNRLSSWDFNIFHLDQVTGGHSLRFVGMQIFQKYDLIHTFHLDPTSLYKCLVAIETGYHGNPYHNALHAADVTQAMYCYLQEEKLREALTPMEVMSTILASATHDLDHPGVNQVFLIATSNHLADLYGNSSVLENHHWRAAISVLRESKLLDHLDKKLWDFVVHQISSLILATDIARQQEFLQNLRNHLDGNDFELSETTHRTFVMQIALKCADICNPCRRWDLSRRWSEMVTEEFYNQGDRERGLQLPLTMNCDRYKNTIHQIQAGFMKFVVEPLFSEWHRFMPTGLSNIMLCNISKNKASWEAFGEQQKAAADKEEKTTNQIVSNKVRKVEGQSDVLKTAQLNNNNNGAATTVIKTITLKTISVVGPGASYRESQETSAMDVETRPMEVVGTLLRADDEKRQESLSGVNVAQGKMGDRDIAPLGIKLSSVESRSVVSKTISGAVLKDIARESMPMDQRRQRPLSVGNLDDVRLTREERRGLNASGRMHSNPASPLVPRTLAARQFSLRLHRSPDTGIKKSVNFEDPWLVRNIDPNRTSPSVLPHSSPRQEMVAPEASAMSIGMDTHRTQPFTSDRDVASARTFGRDKANPKGYEFTTGLNNNVNVCIQPGSPRLETTSVRGHALYSVTSPVSSHRTSVQSRLSSGSEYSHSSQQSDVSRDYGHAAERGDIVSPHVTRREEVRFREQGRAQWAGRSLAEMGSPWIRKRMEERDHRRQLSKSSSIPTSSLSPRPAPRMLTHVRSSWYSVPPALGPVIQDFTTSQLASIAQHKKQSKKLQSEAVVPPKDRF